jgi:hypothetical protein
VKLGANGLILIRSKKIWFAIIGKKNEKGSRMEGEYIIPHE